MKQRIGDIELYYEKEGEGQPLILIHGNGEDHGIFDKIVGPLSADFTVYALDSRGHGSSTPVDTFDYREMAEDVRGFIQALGLEKPAVYGFSDGGIIGLMLACKYPELLSALVISGANTTPDGLKQVWLDKFRRAYERTGRDSIKMMLEQPNLSKADLAKIRIPVLVTAGSDDMIEDDHTRYIADSISDSRLQIYEGETHESYVEHNPMMAAVIRDFLQE
ncbi:alpha/beta hydrolase [Eubacterium sp. 1001713B170207_170306_E7]|uniref:alpha/beta fold hydrolase n=1 Tax=Eubacterium sp. 1001713B170207_170306_E7 TaxID=2787097 RepID=UPI0018971FEE|nr:alpha/beta hydrolase [Eubacterium sp. 1001713B170207_170306_E7]